MVYSESKMKGESLFWNRQPIICPLFAGRVAQMGERGVRNAEVEGSNPFASTS